MFYQKKAKQIRKFRVWRMQVVGIPLPCGTLAAWITIFGQKRRQQRCWETTAVWQRCHFSSSPQLRMSPVINCAVFPHHVEHLIQISRPSVRRGSRECVTEVGRGEWLRPALHKHREFECGRWRMDAQTLTRTHTHIRTRQRFLSFSEC